MSPLSFSVCILDAVMKRVKMGMRRIGVIFLEEGREWRLPGLLYADELVLYVEEEEDLKLMGGRLVELCKGRNLKFNADKSKVMALVGGEEINM